MHIRNKVTGSILMRSCNIQVPAYGAAYSQKLNHLAVVTSLGTGSSITIIYAHAGAYSYSHRFQQRLSCLNFSETTKMIVYGDGRPVDWSRSVSRAGTAVTSRPSSRTRIRMESLSQRIREKRTSIYHTLRYYIHLSSVYPFPRWQLSNRASYTIHASKRFDFPAMIKSIPILSNGIVVANAMDSGIQLLSLDGASIPLLQPIPPTLTVHALNEGRVIVIVPINRDCAILLETATTSQVLTIPARNNLSVPIDQTVVLYASLEKRL